VGETVAAVVRPSPDTAPSEEELRAYCRDHLAAYKTPTTWLFVDALPLTASGKFARTSSATNSPRSPPDVHASDPVDTTRPGNDRG
jgi:acyl-CoA synthetase (AMP-forming)/AMP-acid ligase II